MIPDLSEIRPVSPLGCVCAPDDRALLSHANLWQEHFPEPY